MTADQPRAPTSLLPRAPSGRRAPIKMAMVDGTNRLSAIDLDAGTTTPDRVRYVPHLPRFQRGAFCLVGRELSSSPLYPMGGILDSPPKAPSAALPQDVPLRETPGSR